MGVRCEAQSMGLGGETVNAAGMTHAVDREAGPAAFEPLDT